MKWCRYGTKDLFATAFRNGSKSVATAISSLHKSHMWEGIVENTSDLYDYQIDKTCLIKKFFKRVPSVCDMCQEQERTHECEVQNDLMNNLFHEVVPYTLGQGMFM